MAKMPLAEHDNVVKTMLVKVSRCGDLRRSTLS
jgi:hypothetical protein